MVASEYRVTYEDSVEALKNELREIKETYDPNIVVIENERAPEGNLCLLKFTVKVPSFYLETEDDTNPKPASEMKFYIQVPSGFPKVKPLVFYPPNHRLASVNVFRNGHQCIDEWKDSSSLDGTVRKTLLDIIHDPVVTRYSSMANSSLEKWQKQKTEEGVLPTFETGRLFRKKNIGTPELPTRKPASSSGKNIPPLPTRR